MPLTQDQKSELIAKFGENDKDTGSTKVQVALLTQRITELTEHMKIHKHDHHSRRGLLKMVGRRRRLLTYMQRHDLEGYRALIKELGPAPIAAQPVHGGWPPQWRGRRRQRMSIAVEPEATRVTATIGDKEISFETGNVAKQAHGAVLVQQGDTVVLATAVGRTEGREGADFFPLTVDVEEKAYAAGKIPGGFFKREGRAGEKAILNARMVDRPIRPLWPKGYKNEVQIIVTTLSADMVNGHDILAINGASAALMLSPMPFLGPVGAVRIGRIDGELVVNPTMPELKESTLDLIVCGTPEAITMVEAGAQEVDEETLIAALELAHAEIKKLCQMQIELAAKVGKPKWADGAVTEGLRQQARRSAPVGRSPAVDWPRSSRPPTRSSRTRPPRSADSSTEDDLLQRTRAQFALADLVVEAREAAVYPAVKEQFGDAVRELTDAEQDSKELKSAKRHALLDQIVAGINLPFPARGDDGVLDPGARAAVSAAVDKLYKATVRTKIAVDKRRPDGRSETEIRPIHSEVSVMPRARTARPSSPAARRRRSRLRRSAPARRSSASTTCRSTTQALHPSLQLPAVLGGRDRASCAAPSAATSATARSPSARSCRSSPARRTSRTPCVWCPRSWSRTGRRRWRRSAVRRSR